MGLRWTPGEAAGSRIAEDGDVDVGQVVRRAERGVWVGWEARYWGHDDRIRSAPRFGHDLTRVGGVWPSAEAAMEALEEAHRGASCE